MNYWYAARPSEIFLDLDSRTSLLRALRVLRLAIRRKELYVDAVYYFPTQKASHGHMIVVLTDCFENSHLNASERACWALWMGSDRLRYLYVRARLRAEIPGDLLASKRPYHRKPDLVCHCKEKHKAKTVTDNCPALKMILGERRSVDFYPRVGRRGVKAIRVPVGVVPLGLIERWR